MWTWAFSYPVINILSTVYRKHYGNLEYWGNCSQMHGNHAISWGEYPNWKSVINHTTFKIKIMKSIFLVLWDILLSELRTSTIYFTSEHKSHKCARTLEFNITTNRYIHPSSKKYVYSHSWWALNPDAIPTKGLKGWKGLRLNSKFSDY